MTHTVVVFHKKTMNAAWHKKDYKPEVITVFEPKPTINLVDTELETASTLKPTSPDFDKRTLRFLVRMTLRATLVGQEELAFYAAMTARTYRLFRKFYEVV
jgi:hypothetical protein